jgi:hypothetical protein
MSYNLRYFEKHGRDIKDPWSCRQCVFYQITYCNDNTSTWLVIQPPTKWKEGLKIVDLNKTDYPFALHLRAISSAAATMWEYLEDISNELTELVGLFSSR